METTFDKLIAIAMPLAAKAANGDPESAGEIIEALATTLGRTVARVANGDARLIDDLLMGCENQIATEAAESSRMIADIRAIKEGRS